MDTTDTGTPFVKIRIPKQISLLAKGVRWFLAGFGLTAFSIAAYATKAWIDERISTQTTSITVPLMPLIGKVQTLEEFRERSEKASDKMQSQLLTIYVKLTAVETSQKFTKENTEQILRRLDSVPARR